MLIARLHKLVMDGQYSLGPHALRHAQEDGFEKEHCIGALLDGRVLEDYPREDTGVVDPISNRCVPRLAIVEATPGTDPRNTNTGTAVSD